MTMKKTHLLVTRKKSIIHANGLYAKKGIAKATPIIQYVGKKIKNSEIKAQDPNNCIYLFEINKRLTIDGDIPNNIAKYINHSCEPNCHTEIIKNEVWIYASRDIKKGEELSYDYGFQRYGWQDHPCRCGKENCFGFIVAQTHWASIRKTQRYAKLRKAK